MLSSIKIRWLDLLDDSKIQIKPLFISLLGGFFIAFFLLFLLQSASGAPDPNVTINAPAEVLVGEDFSFSVTFDNTSGINTDVGYGPFIDVILPTNGADGNAGLDTPDGVSFISASYGSGSVVTQTYTFPIGGDQGTCALGEVFLLHPYAVDNTGSPVEVCGIPADTLVVVQLPFGSFVPDQPALDIDFNVTLDNGADLGNPLNIQARGGFKYGEDALYNPTTDPTILSPGFSNATISPSIATISKSYNGPESETVTGPNFIRSYTINVDIADGQSINNVELIDLLPNNIEYIQTTSASPGSCVISPPFEEPTTPGAQNSPDNDLIVECGTVVGAAGGGDADMTLEFFVNQFDADLNSVIDPDTGNDVTSINDARMNFDWDPIDARDTSGSFTIGDIVVNDHTLFDKSIAIQKSSSVAIDNGAPGNSPADVVEYTLNFQISDFFAFENISITDILSDGQHFDTTFTPTLLINEHGSSSAGTMDNLNYVVDDHWTGAAVPIAPIDGTTEIVFEVTDELVIRALDDILHGGCVPQGGTGGGAPDCTSFNGGATTGQLVYRTIIQDEFTDDFPSGDESIDQGDTLTNTVSILGDILDEENTSLLTGFSESDGSSDSFTIQRGSISKEIYAINGSTAYSLPIEITAGDTVTYRLRYDMPTTDVEDLEFIDYFPLPIYDVNDPDADDVAGPGWVFDPTVDGSVPVAGTVKFGPADTFYGLSAIVPTLTTSGASNSLAFTFGSYDILGGSQNHDIDLLFTITVTNEPFADGVQMTNQVASSEGSTNGGGQTAESIVQVEFTQPSLEISKGIVNSDNTGAVYTPTTVGPVAFNAAGSACGSKFVGTINSDGLDVNGIDSDITNVDAFDVQTFAIVVENTGDGVAGAFDIQIRDALPAGYTLSGAVCITDGTGALISTTNVGGGTGLFDQGIELTDPGPTPAGLAGVDGGAIDAYHATSGRNVAVIIYDAFLDSTIESDDSLDNIAELFNYSANEGGVNFIGDVLSDIANTSMLQPGINKIIDDTNIAETTGNDVVIGEIITYEVEVEITEGTYSNAQIRDRLDSGLAFVRCNSITALSDGLPTTDITHTNDGPASSNFSSICNDPTNPIISGDARTATFDFGTVVNNNSDNSAIETILVSYDVVVLNIGSNVRNVNRNNRADWIWDGGSERDTAPNITIKEPNLDINKTASPASADAGDTVTYTLDIDHAGTSDTSGYDILITDVIPSDTTYVGGSISSSCTGLAIPTNNDTGDPTLEITIPELGTAETCQITYDVTIDPTVAPAQSINNDVDIDWTSISGDPGIQSTYAVTSTERSYNDGDNVNITVFGTSPNKELVTTSEDHTDDAGTGTERVAIGEIVRYRMEVRLAEANATNLQIRDNLPDGMQFINDDTTFASFVYDTGDANGIASTTLTGGTLDQDGDDVTINSIVPSFIMPDSAISTSSTINEDTYNSGTDIYFKFGDITNNDNDSNVEYIVLEFNALVLNVPANNTGSSLDNTFSTRIDGSDIDTSSSISVIVAEPNIVLDKSVNTVPVDAGDTVIYDISIENDAIGNNGTDSWEVNFTDTLDSYLTFVQISNFSDPAYVGFTDNTAGNNIDLDFTELRQGDTITFQIEATVNADAPNGYIVPNTGDIEYTSLPSTGTIGGTNTTGSQTPGTTDDSDGERLYNAQNSANTTLGIPVIDKLDVTPNQYTIGDQVVYDILITLPEGETLDLVVDDFVPVGMEYISYQIITSAAASGGVLSSDYNGGVLSPSLTALGGDGVDVEWDFGDQVTTADNNSDNNSFIIELTTQVLNVASNDDGDILTNSVSLDYTDPNTLNTSTVNDPTDVDITIIEPQITTLKTVTPDSDIEAGDQLTYVVRFTNSNNSTAYDVTAVDTLATNTSYNSLVGCLDQLAAPVAITVIDNGSTIGFDGNPAGSLDIDQGNYIECTYLVDVETSIIVDGSYSNTIDADWSSQDGTANSEERTYDDGVSEGPHPLDLTQDDASDSFSINGVTINKTDNGEIEAPINDVVNYTLTITSPLGTIDDLVVEDVLPEGMIFNNDSTFTDISNVVLTISSPNNGSAPVTVEWDFGDEVISSNTMTIEYSATVADVVSNSPGTNIENTATLNYLDASTNPQTDQDQDDFDIVIPDIRVEKEDSGLVAFEPGNTIIYDIDIFNDGGYDADSVVVTETIPVGTVFVPGSSTSSVGASWVCLPDGSAGNDCTFDLAQYLVDIAVDPVDGSLAPSTSETIQFAVQIDSPINPAINEILNSVQAGDDTTHGQDPTPGNNSDTDIDPLNAEPQLSILKDDGITSIDPGQQTTYTITVANLGNQDATGVLIQDTLPPLADINFISASDGATHDGLGLVTWPLIDLPAGDSITRTITIELINTPISIGLEQITNTVDVQDDGTNTGGIPVTDSDSDTDTVNADPILEVTKTDHQTTFGPGQVITYEIEVTNSGNQISQNVEIIDTIPTNTIFSSASDGGSFGGGDVTWPLIDLDAGESVTRFITIQVDNPIPVGITQIDNLVTVEDDGVSSGGVPLIDSDNDVDTLDGLAVPELTINKDDGFEYVVPGQTVVYGIIFENSGTVSSTGVVVTDIVPDDSVFNPGSSSIGWVCLPDNTAGSICTYDVDANIGSPFVPGQVETIQFALDLDVTATGNLLNEVLIEDDGTNTGGVPLAATDDDQDMITSTPISDLGITKTDGLISVFEGQQITYDIQVTNFGTVDATNVVVTDIFDPLEFSFVSATLGGIEAPAGTVVWNLGVINPSDSVDLQVVLDVQNPLPVDTDQITNSVSVEMDETDSNPANDSDSDTDIVGVLPDLRVEKDDGVTMTEAGEELTYTIIVTNDGGAVANNVEIIDSIPANTTYLSNTGNGIEDNGIVTWTINSLDPQQSVVRTVTVQVDDLLDPGVLSIINFVEINYAEEGTDPTPNNNRDVDADNINGSLEGPDLNIIKSDGQTTVNANELITYTLTISNFGNIDSTGVLVEDALPSNVTFNNASDGGTEVGGLVTWPTFDLAVGESVIRTIDVTIDGGVLEGDLVENNVIVSDDGLNGPEIDTTDNEDDDIDVVVLPPGGPDLVLTKSDGVVETYEGDTLIYNINVLNAGLVDASGVVVSETVPIGTTFVPGSSTIGWICLPDNSEGSDCTFDLDTYHGGDLLVGESEVITFVVDVDNPLDPSIREIDNTASVDDDGTRGEDPAPENNIESDTNSLEDGPASGVDLVLIKSDGQTEFSEGEQITYKLTIVNVGDQTASGTMVTDVVPDDSTFNPASSTMSASVMWQCTPDNSEGSTCTFDLATYLFEELGDDLLNPGQSVTINFVVDVDDPLDPSVNDLDNTASVTSIENDLDPSNNSDSDNDSNDSGPVTGIDLSIMKSDGRTDVDAGDTLIYTIIVTNNGPDDATGVEITETVPLNATYNDTASISTWDCVDGDPGGTDCVHSLGSLAAGETQQVSFAVDVNGPLDVGVTSIRNNASVDDDGTNGPDLNPIDNNDSDTDNIGVQVDGPDLMIIKTDGVVEVEEGDNLIYKLNIFNIGTVSADNVTITETVPDDTVFDLSNSTAGWSCADGAIEGTVCTLDIGTLAVDTDDTAEFAVIVNNSLDLSVSNILNTSSVTDDGVNGPDLDPSNNSDDDEDNIDHGDESGVDLIVIKSDGQTEAEEGQALNYTITVLNAGDQDATGVEIEETVPNDTAFNLAASSVGWSCPDVSIEGTTCTLVVGGLASGESISRTFSVDVDNPIISANTSIVNPVSVSSIEPDLNPSDNSDDDVDDIDNGPETGVDLQIVKSDARTIVSPGEVGVTYYLTVNNAGNTAANNVVIQDSIPNGTIFSSASDGGLFSGGVVEWNSTTTPALVIMNPGDVVIISVTVDIDTAPIEAGLELIENNADVDSDEDDVDPSNNSTTDIDSLDAAPDLMVTKNSVIDMVGPNEPDNEITYTIVVQNIGNQIASNVTVVDDLPINTSFVTASNGGNESGGEVSWDLGDISPLDGPITLVLVVRVDDVDFGAGIDSLINNVCVSDDGTNGTDQDESNNCNEESDRLDVSEFNFDLSVNITNNTNTTSPGSTLTYVVTIENVGTIGVTGVQVDVPLPVDVEFISASDDGEDLGGVVTWLLSQLDPGELMTYTFRVRVNSGVTGSLLADAIISDDGTNGVEINVINNIDDDITVIESSGGGGGGRGGSSPSGTPTPEPEETPVPEDGEDIIEQEEFGEGDAEELAKTGFDISYIVLFGLFGLIVNILINLPIRKKEELRINIRTNVDIKFRVIK